MMFTIERVKSFKETFKVEAPTEHEALKSVEGLAPDKSMLIGLRTIVRFQAGWQEMRNFLTESTKV